MMEAYEGSIAGSAVGIKHRGLSTVWGVLKGLGVEFDRLVIVLGGVVLVALLLGFLCQVDLLSLCELRNNRGILNDLKVGSKRRRKKNKKKICQEKERKKERNERTRLLD